MKLAAAALSLALVGCGGGEDTPSDVCDFGDARFDPAAEPCERLSSYDFFDDARAQVPAPDVVPYDVNTPLFSDNAVKHRFVWMPEGASASYRDEGPLDFPRGAVLIKTFGFRSELGDPASPERLIETRLLVRDDDGFSGWVYLWDDEGDDAVLVRGGARVPVQYTGEDGAAVAFDYIVPDENQCKGCHENADAVLPIGPKAGHLNRDLDYPSGTANQLGHWSELGLLTGAPAPADAPRTPVWNDPSTGDLDARARAWLDVACAHCHNPDGPGNTSGLDLRFAQEDPAAFGVCKSPVAAGGGSGGRQYGIVPGEPDASILVYRIESTRPDERMPELGRQLVDEDGVALVRAWIEAMPGSCDPEG